MHLPTEAGRQCVSKNAGPTGARALTQPWLPRGGGRQDPPPGKLGLRALQSHPKPVRPHSPNQPLQRQGAASRPHARPQTWRLALRGSAHQWMPQGLAGSLCGPGQDLGLPLHKRGADNTTTPCQLPTPKAAFSNPRLCARPHASSWRKGCALLVAVAHGVIISCGHG